MMSSSPDTQTRPSWATPVVTESAPVSGFALADLRSAPVPVIARPARSFEPDGPGAPISLAERIREESRAAGYAIGWAQGMREAKAALAAEVAAARAQIVRERVANHNDQQSVLQALSAAAAQVEQAAVPTATELEETILTAALAIAESVLHSEVSHDGAAAVAVRRALQLVPAGEGVTVRLNPGDHAVVVEQSGNPVVLDGRTVDFLADAALAPGDAVAVAGATLVDARISTSLDRIREALR
jgi:flagellar assembly protein FliH